MLACSSLKAYFLRTLSSEVHAETLYEGSRTDPSSFSSSWPVEVTFVEIKTCKSLYLVTYSSEIGYFGFSKSAY